MKKINITILLILFLGGCMSSPSRKYYQLHLIDPDQPVSKTISKTVLVEPIDIDDLYDDFRIVYRLSPFELNYYSYEFWADKPAKLLQDSITHYLLKKKVFQKVIKETSGGEADLQWKSRIHAIEEVDTQDVWYARLAMDVELIDFKSQERLYFHQFDKQEKLPVKSVGMVPVVISRILEEELDRIIRDISERID